MDRGDYESSDQIQVSHIDPKSTKQYVKLARVSCEQNLMQLKPDFLFTHKKEYADG